MIAHLPDRAADPKDHAELHDARLHETGGWGPAQRWWRGNAPEWDVVASAAGGDRLLLGEARWRARPFTTQAVEELAREVARRPAPPPLVDRETVRALFIAATGRRSTAPIAGVQVITSRQLPLLGPAG